MATHHHHPLSLKIICREIVQLVRQTPWQLRGPVPFHAEASFSLADGDHNLCIDALDNILRPAILSALGNKTDPREHNERPPAQSGIAWEYAKHDGVSVLLKMERLITTTRYEYRAEIEYRPSHNDRSMPTYFWLGELAEAA